MHCSTSFCMFLVLDALFNSFALSERSRSRNWLAGKRGNSLKNYNFDTPDFSHPFTVGGRLVQLEAYKDHRIERLWTSLGQPMFINVQQDGSEGIYLFEREQPISMQLSVYPIEQEHALVEALKQLSPDGLVPQVRQAAYNNVTCETRFAYEGIMYHFESKPARSSTSYVWIIFPYSRQSPIAKAFQARVAQKSPLLWKCTFDLSIVDYEKNAIDINAELLMRFYDDTMIFGKNSSEVYVTRQQMNTIAHQFRKMLTIEEQYEFEDEGNKMILKRLLELAQGQFVNVPFNEALAKLSMFGVVPHPEDFSPEIITEMSNDTYNVFKKDETKVYIKSGGKTFISDNSGSFKIGLAAEVADTASAKVGLGLSADRHILDRGAKSNATTEELQTITNNTIQFQQVGQRIIPKSMTVLLLTKAKMTQNMHLKFRKQILKLKKIRKTKEILTKPFGATGDRLQQVKDFQKAVKQLEKEMEESKRFLDRLTATISDLGLPDRHQQFRRVKVLVDFNQKCKKHAQLEHDPHTRQYLRCSEDQFFAGFETSCSNYDTCVFVIKCCSFEPQYIRGYSFVKRFNYSTIAAV